MICKKDGRQLLEKHLYNGLFLVSTLRKFSRVLYHPKRPRSRAASHRILLLLLNVKKNWWNVYCSPLIYVKQKNNPNDLILPLLCQLIEYHFRHRSIRIGAEPITLPSQKGVENDHTYSSCVEDDYKYVAKRKLRLEAIEKAGKT